MKMLLWRRCFLWLGRIGHCRGFGVQSPTDYRFVRNVIIEKAPYYKYEILDHDYPKLDTVTKKMCKLLFRLSNYCQPRQYIDFGQNNIKVFAAYAKAGCNKAKLVSGDAVVFNDSFQTPFLVRLSCRNATRELLQRLLNLSSTDSIFVVEGIKENKEAKSLWQWIKFHDMVTVTYDLYYCGIIITAKRRYKKNYIINF